MKIFLDKAKLHGSVKVIGSKSFAHRLLIANFLSLSSKDILNVPESKDIEATLFCLKALKEEKEPILNCIESGSTLRFLAPLSLYFVHKVTLKGTSRLIERGIKDYYPYFDKCNISYQINEDSIVLSGQLKPGDIYIDGSISSQYITGLLFVLPLLDSDSVIHIENGISSKNYIDITIDVLKQFNIKCEFKNNEIFIKGNQKYIAPNDIEVEGDYSNASFLEAFNYFGSDINLMGLKDNSLQGDRVYKELFNKLNSAYQCIDLKDCIDLSPILFTFASLKYGAEFINYERLAVKESNRKKAMEEELNKVGITFKEIDHKVIIEPNQLKVVDGITFSSHNDHRIAMALSLLSSFMDISIEDYLAVNKSYPNYFKELEKLGGKIRYE